MLNSNGEHLNGKSRRTKSLYQGNSDAPKSFNHSVWLHAHCQERLGGYPIKDGTSVNITCRLDILVFADNFCLLGCSAEQLKTMITTWKIRVAPIGWEFSLGNVCWGTTLKYSIETSIETDGHVVRRVPRSSGFKARGTTFTSDGRCNAEFQFRCGRAWAVLGGKYKNLQKIRNQPLQTNGRIGKTSDS